VLGSIGHQVSLEGVRIRREFDATIPPVPADGDQLRQVFANLVVNAVQAMPDGGELTVTTRFVPARLSCTIIVADTGRGIAPEHLTKIFQPFFTTRGSGTGLGLAVSYGIIRAHGGSIQVTSTPQVGTTFTVTLPCR